MAGIEFPRTMGSQDALMWCVERDPVLRSTNAAITVLDRAPAREVLEAKLEQASQDLPRLRQRVVEPPRLFCAPIWAEDPDFDLRHHLRWMRAAREDGFRAVLDDAAWLAMQGFDRARPLWEFVVVEDLEDGRAAVIQKLHHAVTDGAGGMLLMQRVYDAGPDEPFAFPPVPADAFEDPGALRVVADELAKSVGAPLRWLREGVSRAPELARRPLESVRGAAGGLASLAHVLAPGLAPYSPLLQQRSSRYRFDALSVPVASLKAAAHAADCKLNDAYLAAVAGAWRRYHDHHGVRVAELRASVPIDLRAGGGGAAGNRMMPARIALPLRERDPRRRMRRIRERVAAERQQPALAWIDDLAGATRLLPAPLVTELIGRAARNIDFVAACVPGLPVPLWMAGARVESLYTFGPTVGTAANLTLFSYLDQATLAINADPAAVGDVDVLVECLREGFDEVLKLG